MGTITTTSHALINPRTGSWAIGSQVEIAHRLCRVVVTCGTGPGVVTAHLGEQRIFYQSYSPEWEREEMVRDACQEIVRRLVRDFGYEHFRKIQ